MRRFLAQHGARHGHVTFFHHPINEPWCRDHGPIFVTRKDAPKSLYQQKLLELNVAQAEIEALLPPSSVERKPAPFTPCNKTITNRGNSKTP